MELDMHTRRKLSTSVAKRYRGAGKKEKGRILEEFVASAGYNRDYAAHLLSNWGRAHYLTSGKDELRLVAGREPRRTAGKHAGGRPRTYDEAAIGSLRAIWEFLGYPCGKLLSPMIGCMIDSLARDPEFGITDTVRNHLLGISAATIDRHLKADRKKLELSGRSLTKAGGMLKNQIPIRTFYSWDERKPGYFEADTVSHCGASPAGEFCQTLTYTDVYSGWTEVRALRNKANRWVKMETIGIREMLPFALLGLDSDNGGEFINQQLYGWCTQNNIEFTRGRPYRKNDNCFVEQKNGDVVRKTVGYFRYDTDEEFLLLEAIYRQLCPLRNYWFPTIKICGKTRLENGRYRKQYEKPLTPYQRLLDSPDISDTVKLGLQRRRELTDPVALKRQLDQNVTLLLKTYYRKIHQASR